MVKTMTFIAHGRNDRADIPRVQAPSYQAPNSQWDTSEMRLKNALEIRKESIRAFFSTD